MQNGAWGHLVIACLLVGGCGTAEEAGNVEAGVWAHDLPAIPLANGEEKTDTCFSWSLGNEDWIYVNTIRMEGTPGIHHSNWFYVQEDTYPGPDGIWSCDERGFDTVKSALEGGVLFAQSTQAREEVQQFEEGAVLALPPNAVVVADLHLLNAYGRDLETEIQIELHTIVESAVEKRLIGFSIDYMPLEIAARSRSEFMVECDLSLPHMRALRRPLDFDIHHVLPHYHELGDLLRLEVVGGPNDGEVIWETTSAIGEPLGGRLDPPYDMTGATGLRLTCGFDNPRDEQVGWGVGDQEMCVAFGFTDSERMWGASTALMENVVVGESDGVVYNEASNCNVISAVPEAEAAASE